MTKFLINTRNPAVMQVRVRTMNGGKQTTIGVSMLRSGDDAADFDAAVVELAKHRLAPVVLSQYLADKGGSL